MPNWCENKLEIVGDINETLRRFLKKGLKFSRIVEPVVISEDPTGAGMVSAQLEHWGTKWDLEDDEAERRGRDCLEQGYCFFETAWSPPSTAIEELSRQIPGVKFALYYHEPGCSFYGTEYFENGVMTGDSQDAYGQEYADFLMNIFDYDEYDAMINAGLDTDDDEEEEEEST